MSRRLVVLALIASAALVLAGVVLHWHAPAQHWVAVHLGIVNEGGPFYGFWSGSGSDIGEVTLFAGVLAMARHHNCHVRGCWRLGRPVDGTPYLACHRHHPAHEGAKRGVTAEHIAQRHGERRR